MACVETAEEPQRVDHAMQILLLEEAGGAGVALRFAMLQDFK